MNGKLWFNAVFNALLAASLLLGGCASIGVQKSPALQQKIESARTKADHEELAGYFEQEAKTLQAKAEQHQQVALAYGRPTEYARLENDFIRHCNYLAGRYREAAEANLALAQLHRGIAANAQ